MGQSIYYGPPSSTLYSLVKTVLFSQDEDAHADDDDGNETRAEGRPPSPFTLLLDVLLLCFC